MSAFDLAKFFPSLSTGPAASQAPLVPAVALVDVSGPLSTLTMGNGVENALDASPIAKYPSPRPAQLAGSVIAVSPTLIYYGVKQNMVRVIEIATTAKALLKGHQQPVVDICLGANDTIATVGQDVRLLTIYEDSRSSRLSA